MVENNNREDEYCKYNTLIMQNYLCVAENCPYGNQSKVTLDFEGEGKLPFCLSNGLEKEILDEDIKKLSRDYKE